MLSNQREVIVRAIERYRQNQPNPQPTQLQAALFDMDGVLFDSMPAHARSWKEAVSEAGLDTEEKDYYSYEGQTAPYTIRLLYNRHLQREPNEDEIERIYQRKTALFGLYDHGKPIIGANCVLESVKDLKRVLVTGSSQPELTMRINHTYPNIFGSDNMITGKDVKLGKPHPEPYLKALVKAGVTPQEALVVENAPMGIKAAKAAGIFTIAVNTGPLDDEELWQAGTDLLFDNMEQLAEAIPLIRRLWDC